MSWIQSQIVLDKVDEKALAGAQMEIDENVRRNTDLEEFPNASGVLAIKPLLHDPFTSQQAAENYLEEIQEDWSRKYNPVVAFRDTSKVKPTKTMLHQQQRVTELKQKLAEFTEANSAMNFKAKLISCKKCGSKINKEYIHENECPLCHESFFSKSALTTIASFKERIAKFIKENQTSQECLAKKAKTRYLLTYCEFVD